MTDAPSLTGFLLARIAEDEVRVTTIPDWYCTDSARGEGWGSRGDCRLCGHYMFDGTEDVTEQAYYEHLEDTHRRARVLAECEAKRRIVELHKIEVAAFRAYGGEEGVTFVEPDSFEDITTRRWMCSTCHNIGDDGPCSTLRLLALPYADHPDYDDPWRP
jgi:hypothetical protein